MKHHGEEIEEFFKNSSSILPGKIQSLKFYKNKAPFLKPQIAPSRSRIISSTPHISQLKKKSQK